MCLFESSTQRPACTFPVSDGIPIVSSSRREFSGFRERIVLVLLRTSCHAIIRRISPRAREFPRVWTGNRVGLGVGPSPMCALLVIAWMIQRRLARRTSHSRHTAFTSSLYQDICHYRFCAQFSHSRMRRCLLVPAPKRAYLRPCTDSERLHTDVAVRAGSIARASPRNGAGLKRSASQDLPS